MLPTRLLLAILAFATLPSSEAYPQKVNHQRRPMQQQPYFYYPMQMNPYYHHQYFNYWRPLPEREIITPEPLQPQQPPRPASRPCAGNSACASACLGNPFWYGNAWKYQPPQYYSNPEEDSPVSTTEKPQKPEFAGCQYSDCSMTGTYYGCGLRVGFVPNYGGNSLCGATGGWPNSYCGNELSYSPVCEDNLCSSDCQSYGQNGGYCGDRDNCLCFKQVFKTENNEDSALSLQINEKSNP